MLLVHKIDGALFSQITVSQKDMMHLRGQGGVDREFFWNMVFCVYLIEGSQGYHQLFTESKNIAPSRSYGHLKIVATVQLQYARDFKLRFTENLNF